MTSKSILTAAAALVAAAALLAIAVPGDAVMPRDDFATAAAVPVEYITFEPMELTALGEGIVMEPLVIVVDEPEVEVFVMEPLHIVAGDADTTPVAAL